MKAYRVKACRAGRELDLFWSKLLSCESESNKSGKTSGDIFKTKVSLPVVQGNEESTESRTDEIKGMGQKN